MYGVDENGLVKHEDFSGVRQSIREGNLNFNFSKSSSPGVFVCEGTISGWMQPVAFVWFRHKPIDCISIAGSYVNEIVRRCGARTLIHKELLRCFPETRLMVTGSATEFSIGWLKKNGFTFSEKTKRWELEIEPTLETNTFP